MPVAEPLLQRARRAAQVLRENAGRDITVVHHIDADGVSAGAIALEALHRAGLPALSHEVRSLDDLHIARIKERKPEMLWFCDLGSAAYMNFPGIPKIVCDHHELVRDGSEDFPGHVNPLLDDLPGTDISGAGAAYLVASCLDQGNRDLIPMALVGAAADQQARETGRFEGSNAALLEEGIVAGSLEAREDLAFYGSETRPLTSFLAYTDDRPIPGITGDRRGASRFLEQCGVASKRRGKERPWIDLSGEEQERIRSALVQRRLDCGQATDDLWRQVVNLPGEDMATPLHELQEFGTLLNATARYDRADVGLAVARGQRGAALKEALGLRDGHRKHLVASLDVVARVGVEERQYVQWFHAQDGIRDTVVGIVCGMALDGLGLRSDLALIGFATTPEGQTKVSSRASGFLQAQGIDLALAMRSAATTVGGQGGGHKGAAGATIPAGEEMRFLDAVETSLQGVDSRLLPTNMK